RVESYQVLGRNSHAILLQNFAIVAEHGDKRLLNRGLHSLASRLVEEACGDYCLNQPECVPWMLRLLHGFPTDKAIVIGNLVEHERRDIPADIGHGIDLLAHDSIGEERGELRFLLSGKRVCGAADTDDRHDWSPFV